MFIICSYLYVVVYWVTMCKYPDCSDVLQTEDRPLSTLAEEEESDV